MNWEEEKMVKNKTAYLSNENNCISFRFNNTRIRFMGPHSLIRIEKVKEWDNGYIVVDARYDHSQDLVEDYIDLIPMLDRLYINKDEFLSGIENVEVAHV